MEDLSRRIAILEKQKVKKKRKPSAYNIYVKRQTALGLKLHQSQAKWRKLSKADKLAFKNSLK